MRVFIGLKEIAGYNSGLRDGLKSIGIDAHFVDLWGHKFQYDEELFSDKLISNVRSALKSFINTPTLLNKIKYKALSVALFIRSISEYDAFIYASFTNFFSFYELKVLKLFNKKVIYIFYGSEARPAYLNGSFIKTNLDHIKKLAHQQKHSISIIEKYADFIINHPPTAQFCKKKFILWYKIGIPFSKTTYEVTKSIPNEGVITILHAPSNPFVKGTQKIISTIKNLKSEGFKINFVKITNLPNAKVLQNLQNCDFVVDELYSDAFMAMFATEAAYFGKPAIVCGYINQSDLGTLNENDIPPVLYSNPDKLKQSIIKLIEDKQYRMALGEKAHSFVVNQWNFKKFARKYEKLLNGQPDNDWFYSPHDVQYIYGFGIQLESLKHHLRKYISKFGEKALYLNHNQALKNRLIKFAFGQKRSVD